MPSTIRRVTYLDNPQALNDDIARLRARTIRDYLPALDAFSTGFVPTSELT